MITNNIEDHKKDTKSVIPVKDIREKKTLTISKTFRFDWDIWIARKIKSLFKRH